jgi:hypothetical protein
VFFQDFCNRDLGSSNNGLASRIRGDKALVHIDVSLVGTWGKYHVMVYKLVHGMPCKVHPLVQDAGHIHSLAGQRVDYKMMLNVKSQVMFGEVGPLVPYAGVVGNRFQRLMESGLINLPLPLSIGFVGVL